MPTLLEKGKMIPPSGATKKVIVDYLNATPISIIINWLKKRMHQFGGKIEKYSDRILVITAKTGSGKSTTLPVELFRIFKPESVRGYSGPSIIVTQPRILTTQEIAKDISSSNWANDMILGYNIGYSTGSGKISTKNGGLVYVTIGTLLQQLLSDNAKNIIYTYKFIILDEVHERSIELDIVLYLLKKFIKLNYKDINCPFIILTSATFDTDKYCNYFDINPKTNTMEVTGSVYPISENFIQNNEDIIISGIKIIKDIHEEKINPMPKNQNDILIFCPGMWIISKYKDLLTIYNKDLLKDKKQCFIIITIDAKAVNYNTIDRQLIYMNIDDIKLNNELKYDINGSIKIKRRIILSTNVAETGLTISTLGHCIDTGWKNIKEIYHPYNIDGIIQKPIHKSNSIQRRGRVGRKFPGHFYTLYDEETFKSLKSIDYPSIVMENINKWLLYLFDDDNCFSIDDLDLLDLPPVDNIKTSIENNLVLGYIESDYGKCYKVSPLGLIFKKTVNLSNEEFKILQCGYIYNVCIMDLITIISMINIRFNKINISNSIKESLPNFFFKNENFIDAYNAITMDDYITGFFIFESFSKIASKGINKLMEWCEKVSINYDEMMEVLEKRIKYIKDLSYIKFDINYNKERSLLYSNKSNYIEYISNIKKCLYEGFKLNLIHNDKEMRTYKNRFNFDINISLQNKEIGFPKHLVTDKISIITLMNETFTFQLRCEKNSVLDGYCQVNNDILLPIDIQDKTEEKILKNKRTYRKNNINRLENYNRIMNMETTQPLFYLNDKYKDYL